MEGFDVGKGNDDFNGHIKCPCDLGWGACEAMHEVEYVRYKWTTKGLPALGLLFCACSQLKYPTIVEIFSCL